MARLQIAQEGEEIERVQRGSAFENSEIMAITAKSFAESRSIPAIEIEAPVQLN